MSLFQLDVGGKEVGEVGYGMQLGVGRLICHHFTRLDTSVSSSYALLLSSVLGAGAGLDVRRWGCDGPLLRVVGLLLS